MGFARIPDREIETGNCGESHDVNCIVVSEPSFVQLGSFLPFYRPAADNGKIGFQLDAVYVLIDRRHDFNTEVVRIMGELSTGTNVEPIAAAKWFNVGGHC